jgi:hypothetical protein
MPSFLLVVFVFVGRARKPTRVNRCSATNETTNKDLQKLMDEFLLSFQPSRPAISGQKIKIKKVSEAGSETAPAGAARGSATPRRAADLYIFIFWEKILARVAASQVGAEEEDGT